MSYGMLITDPSDYLLIDSDFKVQTKLATGSTAISSGMNNVDITDTTLNSVVAVRPATGGFVAPWGFVMSGSTKTHLRLLSDASQTVDWIVYQEGMLTAEPAYGISIYNSAGTNVWHSDDNYMCIKGVHSFSSPFSYSSTVDVSVLDATNNYFLLQNPAYYWNTTGSAGSYTITRYAPAMKKISSGVVRIGTVSHYSSSVTDYGGSGYSSQGFSYLIEFSTTK